MGRRYNIPLPRTVVSASVDLAELATSTFHVCVIHEIHLSQITKVSDAGEEQIQLAWKTGQTTAGSGGTININELAILPTDPDTAMVSSVFNTTKASGGTIVTHKVWDWNLRLPFRYICTQETRLIIPPSTRATLELVTAPAAATSFAGRIFCEILG